MSHPRVKNIAVFVSGNGSNLEALLEAQEAGFFQSKISLVVSNNDRAYALVRAKNHGVDTYIPSDSQSLLDTLERYEIDFIILAGYLKILDEKLLAAYEGNIINIHPSLLPKYGGMGMYGMHVHEAVFEAKDKISGVTVHFVTEEVDGGDIILQYTLNITKLNSPEEIQKALFLLEHQALKTAVKMIEEEYI